MKGWNMNTVLAKTLSDAEVERVHETSLKVLQEVGVDICHDQIRSKLLAAGAKPGTTNNRVIFPAEMVMAALNQCERDITLSSVKGEKYKLSPESRFYSSCCIDPFMIDYYDGKRPPKLKDCSSNARLIDALDTISMPYKMDVDFSDVSGEKALLESNYAFMSNMTKHYICAPHNVKDANIWMEMSEIMADTSLKKNRIVSAIVSPISPLTFDKQFLDLIEFLVPYDIMLILLPCPLAGASSPFSIVGTVVIFNAENLAAITTIQTLHPGAAIFYHNVGQSFNMRTTHSSLGGPEKILCALAGAEMGRFYNLPCGSAGTATDSARYDIQNGAETMSQLLPTISGKANIVTGIGSIGNGMGTSAEQILFACDLIALVEYLRKGICLDDTHLNLTFEAIKRIGPGGNFLMDENTIELLRSGEHFYEGSFERAGSTEEKACMYENLHVRVQEILSNHKLVIPEKRVEMLRKYVHDFKNG